MVRTVASTTCLLAVACALAAAGTTADAQEGRYVIVTVPLGLESDEPGTPVLLDTTTGRSWHIMLDDKGRPRWRGVEFMGGSQGIAAPPEDVNAQAPGEAAETSTQ